MAELDVRSCSKPWKQTYIHVNGDLKPCCYSRGNFGNLNRANSLRDLTEGPLAGELREFVSANRIHPICSNASCAYVRERASRPEDYEDAKIWAAGNARVPSIIPRDLGLSQSITDGARTGNRNCIFKIGLALYRAGRLDEATQWFEASSEAGSEFGHMMLGRIYYSPLGKAKKDLAKARDYFQRAADEGLGQAFIMLGRMALDGHGGDAAEYYRTAGERGDPEGWYRLAELYRHGEAVERNSAEADRYLKLAANRGHAGAREMLGLEAQTS